MRERTCEAVVPDSKSPNSNSVVGDKRFPPVGDDLPNILVASDIFPPGFKGGGPIRTMVNMIDRLSDCFHFRVITRDRDHLDTRPYCGIESDRWLEAYGCEVIYLSPSRWSIWSLRGIIRNTSHLVIYLNSFFSVASIRIVILWRLGMVERRPLVLAPRGQFSNAALSTNRRKQLKKAIFVCLSRLIGLYRGVLWQATCEAEKRDILRHFPARVIVAPNLPGRTVSPAVDIHKNPGEASFVFISRISVVKNLDYALDLLLQINGEVRFDIYGPVEDSSYWKKCSRMIACMPSNVHIRYCGQIVHDEVAEIFAKHHFFLFPTRSENFGHVVLESLSAGCPVVLSDQTPWHDLERNGAGWNIALTDRDRFIEAIRQCVEMDYVEYAALSRTTREYGMSILNDESAVQLNRDLFKEAVADCRNQHGVYSRNKLIERQKV